MTSVGKFCSIVVDGVTYSIPERMCAPFGSYPNACHITEQDRQYFHPVIEYPAKNFLEQLQRDNGTKFPTNQQGVPIKDYSMPQFTANNKEPIRNLATVKECQASRDGTLQSPPRRRDEETYGLGRYDEDRVGMYSSALFDAQNEAGLRRTLHIGLDLGAPVGTPVHAFCDGVVHAAGYNAPHGDYGYVVVIKHLLPKKENDIEQRIVYALYGHLGAASTTTGGDETALAVGDEITKGQVVGRLGDVHENGGWLAPHVHFQLSLTPPPTHDMPGTVVPTDRARALVEYPDPRYVLGPLYNDELLMER